jgi:hypothetical protein
MLVFCSSRILSVIRWLTSRFQGSRQACLALSLSSHPLTQRDPYLDPWAVSFSCRWLECSEGPEKIHCYLLDSSLSAWLLVCVCFVPTVLADLPGPSIRHMLLPSMDCLTRAHNCIQSNPDNKSYKNNLNSSSFLIKPWLRH